MRVLVQRVGEASVQVEGKITGQIGRGFLLFVGVAKGDGPSDLEWMINKITSLRIFSDGAGKMNLNLTSVGGAILSVSQFTLCADMSKGTRPGFENAAPPDEAKKLWTAFNAGLKEKGFVVEEGIFGADMKVSLANEGPVTLWLDSKK